METNKMCTNVIKVTYYGTNAEKYDASQVIIEYLAKWNVLQLIMQDDLVSECHFQTPWTAPLTIWEELVTIYPIDIIGVAYELSEGYVESFTYYTQLCAETGGGGEFVTLTSEESLPESVITKIVNNIEELDELAEPGEGLNIEFTDKEIVE